MKRRINASREAADNAAVQMMINAIFDFELTLFKNDIDGELRDKLMDDFDAFMHRDVDHMTRVHKEVYGE